MSRLNRVAAEATPVQHLDPAQAERIDMAMLLDKRCVPGRPFVDGYEARRQDRAIALERSYPEGF